MPLDEPVMQTIFPARRAMVDEPAQDLGVRGEWSRTFILP